MREWKLKSICLPGGICVSYSGSPELATKALKSFHINYPKGTNYSTTVEFFEASSVSTNNDYIIAFADPAKIVTIRDGSRTAGLSKTHWIGDKDAYERFREYEYHRSSYYERGTAVSTVLFADEMTGSPASDLYSVMRNVTLAKETPSVGGFVTVLSNRDGNFRFSVYSDVLFDWTKELSKDKFLQLTDKFDLKSSGENNRYSISQISSGYYNINSVAFYVLSGKLLVLFYEIAGGDTACATISNVEPDRIATVLDSLFTYPFHAMCLVMSAREEFSQPLAREDPEHGLGARLYCEVNTMPSIPTLPQED